MWGRGALWKKPLARINPCFGGGAHWGFVVGERVGRPPHLSDGLKQPLCPQLRKHPVLPADQRRLGGEILRLGHLPAKLWLPRGPAFQQGSEFSAERSPGTRAAEVCSGKCHGKGAGPCLFVAPLPLSVASISTPPKLLSHSLASCEIPCDRSLPLQRMCSPPARPVRFWAPWWSEGCSCNPLISVCYVSLIYRGYGSVSL